MVETTMCVGDVNSLLDDVIKGLTGESANNTKTQTKLYNDKGQIVTPTFTGTPGDGGDTGGGTTIDFKQIVITNIFGGNESVFNGLTLETQQLLLRYAETILNNNNIKETDKGFRKALKAVQIIGKPKNFTVNGDTITIERDLIRGEKIELLNADDKIRKIASLE